MAKKSELQENLISREQVRNFETSELAKTAKELLARPPEKINRNHYCQTRDFLFSQIHFGNACRSGVTANMLIKEFDAAKRLPDGRFNLKVAKHKTRRSYGPANVTLTGEQFK